MGLLPLGCGKISISPNLPLIYSVCFLPAPVAAVCDTVLRFMLNNKLGKAQD